MQQSVIRNIALSLCLGAGLASADKITLASGEVIEGKIIEETADKYVIKVQLKGGIRDRRTYNKIDVKSVEEEAPDVKPFQALQGILPTANQLTVGQYTELIEGRVKPFLSQFPKSDHVPAVKKILAELEGELAKLKAGDVKLNGKWIPAAEWNADAIEFDARVAFSKMQKLAKSKSYRAAMVSYDQIQENFSGTQAAKDARALASRLLPTYRRIVERMASEAEEKLAKHKKSIQNLPSRDANRVREAFALKMAKHEAAIAKSRKDRNKWLPINEFDEKNLKRLRSHIDSTLRKFERPARSGKNLGERYREVWQYATAGDAKKVKRLLAKLKSSKVDQKYLDLITAQLEANPAPEPKKEEPKPVVKKQPKKEQPKKNAEKKKPMMAEDSIDDEPLEEESSSMTGIVGGIMGLALVGILATVLLGKKKKAAEAE